MSAPDAMPWLPLYIGDFMRVTVGWTLEERGAYLMLLLAQWDAGSLPVDHDRLARIMGADAETFSRVWPTLSQHFDEIEARGLGLDLVNRALAALREKQVRFRERQRAGGRATAARRWGTGDE